MSKRSPGRPRHRGDFYATPLEAVLPLLPHLEHVRTFAEPCAGDGALVAHLVAYGLHCAYSGDIATGQDAFKLTDADLAGADVIITNPPFTRPIMHAMIEHFSELVPTWLLIELDWFATIQSASYVFLCSDIVPIGRIRWMPDTKMSSYDNFVWARFDATHTSSTILHPRTVMEKPFEPNPVLVEWGKELQRDEIREAMEKEHWDAIREAVEKR